MPDRYAVVRRLDFNDWHEILFGADDYESPRIEPVAVAMLEHLAKTFDELLDARRAAERFSQPDVVRRTTAEVIRRAKTFNNWYDVWNTSKPSTGLSRRAFYRAWRLASTFKDWERMTYACNTSSYKGKLPAALVQLTKRCRTFKQFLVAWRYSRHVPDARPAIEREMHRLTKNVTQREEWDQEIEAEDVHRRILRSRGLPVV